MDIEDRLNRIERRMRLWQRVAGASIVVAGLALIAGASKGPKAIVCESLEIRGKDGENRITFHQDQVDDQPYMLFSDNQGRARMVFLIGSGGHPAILMYNEKEEPLVSIVADHGLGEVEAGTVDQITIPGQQKAKPRK